MNRVVACCSLSLALAALSGCALQQNSSSAVKMALPSVQATGLVHGGQQPVSGATIQLYAVGTTGFGSAPTALLTSAVTTSDGTGLSNSNANTGNSNNSLPVGQFTLNFAGSYTCPTASTLVYMTATGGNPGLGGTANNSAIVMLAPLGQCGSLNSSTFISLNEVTTVASVVTLSTFMSTGGNIGSPSDAANQQALSNAFAGLTKIVTISTGAALAGFPKLNTLANSLVPCVNTSGPTSSNCVTLFADATPGGGTTPTTVLGAALNILLNPTLNGTAIYNLSTANAPFQPALTSAPGVWNITTGGAASSACGTFGGGDNVSGTVSYAGSKTGRIYLALNNNLGCGSGTEGTSIAGPGTFTIHGVPPGNYTLQAFMDTRGSGSANAANPGGSALVSVNNPNVSGANVTLTDPATVTVTSPPSIIQASGMNNGAVVIYNKLSTNNGTEIPTSYTLEWSTNASMTPIAGSKTFAAIGGDTNVWWLNGLTNGSVYYFAAYGSSAGTAVGPLSSATGPVTIGAPSGGSTVSGSVGFTGAATGPMYTGFYNQYGLNVYVQNIPSPVSLQAYSVNLPNNATAVYLPATIIDQNNDGLLDPGDITNINSSGSSLAVTGNIANQNTTLASGNVNARVITQAIQSGSTRYALFFQLTFQGKQPVAVTLLNSYNSDGANIDNGPLDVANCAVDNSNCGNGTTGFQIYFNLNSTVPTAGDTYFFNVTYSDGTSETVPVTISNVLTTFATNLAPQTGAVHSTTPTFTWTDPVCGACSTYTYTFFMSDSSNNPIWYVAGGGNGLPAGTNSLTWAVDPYNAMNLPKVGSLTVGTTYSWAVTVQDSNLNQATTVVNYQP